MPTRVFVSFDEVKARVRIAEVMQLLGVDLTKYTEGRDGSLSGPCPLRNHPIGDPNHRNPRQFRIDCKDGIDVFKCFASDCNAGGSVIQFAMQMLDRDAAHVRYFFADHWGDRLTGTPSSRPSLPAKKEPREEAKVEAAAPTQGLLKAPVSVAGNRDADKEFRPMDHFLRLDPNVEYLKQRGLSPTTLERYGVGYASRGRMKGYVCMPVFDYPHVDGSYPLVYLGRFAGEDFIEKNRPKYLWGAANFEKTKVLLGLPQAMENIGDRPIVVTEGMFDLLAVADAGYSHVVACVGSDLSDEQAQLLIRLKHDIVLLFDSDESGRCGARKAAGKLIRDTSVRVISLPDGTDPGGLPVNQLRQDLSFLL
jgi:DNA primase